MLAKADGCSKLNEWDLEEARVENWDREAGIQCSHEPYPNGRYPVGSVSTY